MYITLRVSKYIVGNGAKEREIKGRNLFWTLATEDGYNLGYVINTKGHIHLILEFNISHYDVLFQNTNVKKFPNEE